MPWKTTWVDPEKFLEYNGVTIYHVYKENELQHPFTFHYTTDPDYMEDFSDEGDRYQFDIRDLKIPEPDTAHKVVDALTPPPSQDEEIAHLLRKAIDAGIIATPE